MGHELEDYCKENAEDKDQKLFNDKWSSSSLGTHSISRRQTLSSPSG